MASSKTLLSPLQRDVLEAFFDRTQHFFLTGGAALAAFYLQHRETKDLDLFATPDVDIGEGVRALRDAATAAGATVTILEESGDFRRFAVGRGGDLTLVDLVIDRAPQANPDKATFGRIRVDPAREIAANKLCALLDRSEPRDLFDLGLLLESGISLEDACADALKKHASADPATLAWAISQMPLAPTAVLKSIGRHEQLEALRDALVDQLTKLAFPGS